MFSVRRMQLGDLSPDQSRSSPQSPLYSVSYYVTELLVDSRVDQPIMGRLVVLTQETSSIPENILHARGINSFIQLMWEKQKYSWPTTTMMKIIIVEMKCYTKIIYYKSYISFFVNYSFLVLQSISSLWINIY